MTTIEWTDETWNPIAGCDIIFNGKLEVVIMSPACEKCYARKMALRLMHMGQEKYREGFRLRIHRESFDIPKHWRKPRKIFVCSMGDLFHMGVPSEVIQELLDIMESLPRHTFQLLTKRAERLKDFHYPDNVWVGVTVENQAMAEHRIPHLFACDAGVKFLSCEPLLEQIDLRPWMDEFGLSGGPHVLSWILVGGESDKSNPRPMKTDWVRIIRDLCVETKTAFHFKQYGGKNKKKAGRILDGRTWDECPEVKTEIKKEQYCGNCKNRYNPRKEEPCKSCTPASNKWEPIGDEP